MATTSDDNLQFRIATSNDAPKLQRLVEAAFRAEDSRKDWTADMVVNERFRMDVKEVIHMIAKPDSVLLIATTTPTPTSTTENPLNHYGDTFAACVGISKRGPNLARLGPLAVDTTQQRRGLGRRVLAYAEDYCRRAWGGDVHRMELNVLSTRRELMAWYVRCGYRTTGAWEPFPFDKFADLELPEDLCLFMLEKDLCGGEEGQAVPAPVVAEGSG